MATKSTEQRATVKDLLMRIADLENRVRDQSGEIQRLDQRIQKMADLLALSQAERFSAPS